MATNTAGTVPLKPGWTVKQMFAILSASVAVLTLVGISAVYNTWIVTIVSRNSGSHSLLLDFAEISLGKQTSKMGAEDKTINARFHYILWYNIPVWISIGAVNKCMATCPYKNCQFVTNKTLISRSSAVIFCSHTKGIGETPPLQAPERPKNQAWILYEIESPEALNTRYKHSRPTWQNSFNWTMNFRLDSDIPVLYGYLKTRRIVPYQNYSDIYRNKTKFAAWVVSNCKTVSLRRKFVAKLKEYGLEIDVYGKCGKAAGKDPKKMISNDYKFYLSFENSLCSDYITEKYFKYFPLNTVLVVRGGADYKSLLPDNTYINTADFYSFAELAQYLKDVGASATLYTEYLRAKDKYDSISDPTTACPAYCDLCWKVNHIENSAKVYDSVPNFLETCHKPNDIEKMVNASARFHHITKSMKERT